MEKIISNAALPDTRPQSEKEKNYNASEIAAAVAVTLFKNVKPTKVPATLYNQWYVGSCVLHGFYTQLELEGIVAPAPNGMSQLRAYRKRSNYPNPGTAAADGYAAIKSGQAPNIDAPTTPGMTEAQATAMPYQLGVKMLKDFNYFEFAPLAFWNNGKTIENDLALTAVATGKAVAMFLFATDDEWSQEYVTVKDPNLQLADAYVRHCICIIPKSDFTENGNEWIAVQDSAAFGGRHLRYISRNFFNKRAYYASEVFPKGEVPTPQPPAVIVKPLTPVKLGDRGTAVKELQAYLSDKGNLEPQYITGYYGALTAKAVLWYQLERWEQFPSSVGEIPGLLELGGKYWGPASIGVAQQDL